jgi:ribokinase
LELAKEILDTFDSMEGIVITLGGEGVVARFRQNGTTQDFKVPCRKVAVKDTTGAGDTFVVSNNFNNREWYFF